MHVDLNYVFFLSPLGHCKLCHQFDRLAIWVDFYLPGFKTIYFSRYKRFRRNLLTYFIVKQYFWKVSPKRRYLSINVLVVQLHQTAVRIVRHDNFKFQFVFCSALWWVLVVWHCSAVSCNCHVLVSLQMFCGRHWSLVVAILLWAVMFGRVD